MEGARLVQEAEALAAHEGTRTLSAIHSSRAPARVAFEALLARCGWSTPREFEARICGRAGWAHRARGPWRPFLARWERGGYGSSTWERMTEEDRREVERLAREQTADHRSPLELAPGVERVDELSLLLRQRERIVGWLVGARGAAPDSIHYSHGWVVPALQRLGWLIAGMHDVCERQAARMGERSLTLYETDATNREMRRFVEKHLAPFTEWVDVRYRSEKSLVPPG